MVFFFFGGPKDHKELRFHS